MRHVKGLRLPKRRGLHSSHSQPQPKLRRPRHRCAHTRRIESTWSGVKQSMPRTGTSKDLFESYLWRRSFWKHNQAYRRLIWNTQRCVKWSVPRTTVCTVRDLIVASWRKETKYTASTHGNELEEGNHDEKTTKDTMKVFALILFFFVLI